LFCLVLLTGFSLLAGDGFHYLNSLKKVLGHQREQNLVLEKQVENLRREVYFLENDDRALEKAVRNELGMMAPDEMLFIFDKKSERQRR
ncbi:MAG: hypothetical protein D6719_00825, partial [Candidatus Dadabacteria bacterium]